jgi:hypothetical protein
MEMEAEEFAVLEEVTWQPLGNKGTEVLARATVNCKVLDLARELKFFAVNICKSPINPISSLSHSNHLNTYYHFRERDFNLFSSPYV